MNKKKTIDLLIMIFGYLLCASFPFGLFIKGEIASWLIPVLEIGMQVVYIIFWILFLPKSSLKLCKIKTNLKNYLLILPVVLVFGSNLIYGAIHPEDCVNKIEFSFMLKILLTAIVVTNEEFLFRYILCGNLDKIEKPIWKIILSAGIFGICHIGPFLNTFNPADLLPVAYTFGLGLALGTLYVYGGAPCTCICLHLLFNIVNGVIFESLFVVSDYLTYILVNCGIALFFAIYLLIIYFVRLRNVFVYNVRDERI